METDNAATDNDQQEFEYVISPQVAHDGAGNVFLAWKKRVDLGAGPPVVWRFDMWARIFDVATSTWGAPTLLETHDMDTSTPPQITSVYSPTLAVGASGVAIVGWYYGYEHDIWANIYR
jgi:hypothetical protein